MSCAPTQNAIWKLQNVAKLDPFHESSMDLYAYLLKKENELMELNRLGHTLVRANAARAMRHSVGQFWACMQRARAIASARAIA